MTLLLVALAVGVALAFAEAAVRRSAALHARLESRIAGCLGPASTHPPGHIGPGTVSLA